MSLINAGTVNIKCNENDNVIELIEELKDEISELKNTIQIRRVVKVVNKIK